MGNTQGQASICVPYLLWLTRFNAADAPPSYYDAQGQTPPQPPPQQYQPPQQPFPQDSKQPYGGKVSQQQPQASSSSSQVHDLSQSPPPLPHPPTSPYAADQHPPYSHLTCIVNYPHHRTKPRARPRRLMPFVVHCAAINGGGQPISFHVYKSSGFFSKDDIITGDDKANIQ